MAAAIVTLLCLVELSFASVRQDPERNVEISIYDLIPRKTHRQDQVSRHYVEKIVSHLKSFRSHFLACVSTDEPLKSTFVLKIATDGIATVATETTAADASKDAADCVSEVLRRFEYPRHAHKGNVEIELPLEIEHLRL